MGGGEWHEPEEQGEAREVMIYSWERPERQEVLGLRTTLSRQIACALLLLILIMNAVDFLYHLRLGRGPADVVLQAWLFIMTVSASLALFFTFFVVPPRFFPVDLFVIGIVMPDVPFRGPLDRSFFLQVHDSSEKSREEMVFNSLDRLSS